MRILLLNQFFWPDLAPTGQYLSDVARYLAANGHDVTVICSQTAYSGAESEGEAAPPVRILRVPGLPFRKTIPSRVLSYFVFFLLASLHSVRLRRFDVVVTLTTPPLLSVVGRLVKMLRGSRHFIWEMDVFPDALVTTGAMGDKGLLIGLLRAVQGWTRRHSDGVIALGPCMKARLVASGTPAELVQVVENWADGSVIRPQSPAGSEALQIFYSGNLGRAHDVGTVADAIRYFRNNPRLRFSFAGRGVGRNHLLRICESEDIQNVSFPGYASREDVSAHLAKADVGLVTELASCVGTIVPSKVYGLLAASRPILFVGPRDATPALLIKQFDCGWQTDPGNATQLIELLDRLSENREEIVTKGQNGWKAFRENYDLPIGVARFAAVLGLGEAKAAVLNREAAAAAPVNVACVEP